MKKIRIVLFSLAGLVILVATVSYFLPSTFRVERSITIQADAETIHSTLNDLKTWEKWGLWSAPRDTALNFKYSEKTVGKDAERRWKQGGIGAGYIRIAESEKPRRLTFDYSIDTGVHAMVCDYLIEESGNGCKVTLIINGNFRKDMIEKYVGLGIDGMLGPKMERNLSSLKDYIEKEG